MLVVVKYLVSPHINLFHFISPHVLSCHLIPFSLISFIHWLDQGCSLFTTRDVQPQLLPLQVSLLWQVYTSSVQQDFVQSRQDFVHSRGPLKAFHHRPFLAVQTQLSPSTSQALPRLTSDTAKLLQFQPKGGGARQIPLLAPPPEPLTSQLPSQLSGPLGKFPHPSTNRNQAFQQWLAEFPYHWSHLRLRLCMNSFFHDGNSTLTTNAVAYSMSVTQVFTKFDFTFSGASCIANSGVRPASLSVPLVWTNVVILTIC